MELDKGRLAKVLGKFYLCYVKNIEFSVPQWKICIWSDVIQIQYFSFGHC